MKAVAYIPRGTDPSKVPQDIESDLTAAQIEWTKELSSTGCTYLVPDENYEVGRDLIEDPYKVIGT